MSAMKTTLNMTVMKTPPVPTRKAVSHALATTGTLEMASLVTSIVMQVLLKLMANVPISTSVEVI